ncbi:MAG TPA: YbjN domain-containing protein [Thermosynechococcaceae cyanobacterium]
MTTLQTDSETPSTEINSNNIVEVIETVIHSLDSDTAMVSQNEGGHIWKFKYGTVEVFVQLTGVTNDDTLTVWSPVLKLPAKDEAQLTRQLLETNWLNTLEARFAIFNNEVVVLTTRTLEDLSPAEISRSVTIVATIADENDEPLIEKYGQ